MNLIDKYVSPFLKAHIGGLGSAFALLLADLQLNAPLDKPHWVAIAGAYLGVGALVHTVPNTASAADVILHDDGTDDEPVADVLDDVVGAV